MGEVLNIPVKGGKDMFISLSRWTVPFADILLMLIEIYIYLLFYRFRLMST
jgi:hypothetical protein